MDYLTEFEEKEKPITVFDTLGFILFVILIFPIYFFIKIVIKAHAELYTRIKEVVLLYKK